MMGTNLINMRSHNNVAASSTPAGDLAAVVVGRVYNLTAFNPHASAIAYLHFYDERAASVVVGTTVPRRTFPLPPMGGVDTARTAPIEFPTAISYAVTLGATGSTPPSSACVVGFEYTLAG
jgi:hypothetical protein